MHFKFAVSNFFIAAVALAAISASDAAALEALAVAVCLTLSWVTGILRAVSSAVTRWLSRLLSIHFYLKTIVINP